MKSKQKKSKFKKKLGITSEEEYTSLIKIPFTLRNYIPKDFFGNDSSNDDSVPKDEAI